jgi:hypothetical protein
MDEYWYENEFGPTVVIGRDLPVKIKSLKYTVKGLPRCGMVIPI